MKERLFVITDAVTETDIGQYPHQRAGDKYESNGILSGSALTMAKAVKKLVDNCRVELGEALRMCSLYPARVFGTTSDMGKIEKGYPANMVVMDENLEVMKLISWHPVYSGSHE
jgi:N-acetylglucosamine-6-phosphate deacetylase